MAMTIALSETGLCITCIMNVLSKGTFIIMFHCVRNDTGNVFPINNLTDWNKHRIIFVNTRSA